MSDDLFKTIAFTSSSSEVKQSLADLPEAESIRASIQGEKDSQALHEDKSDSESSQSLTQQVIDDENVTQPVQNYTVSPRPKESLDRQPDDQSVITSLEQASDQVPADQVPATNKTNELKDGLAEASPVESSQSQKLYDRFNRTIEQSSLELFQDPTSTGVAWMIRDKDDAIEHRDRLLVDNKAYYKRDKIEYIPYVIVVLGLAIGAWLFWNSSSAETKHIEDNVNVAEPALVE